ncbi:aminodeoxychorismate lyase [methanotrophic bacterial endosymbiont of Bathymodiolus sp.]|nr:aminodeoxychorismate lyase [methanotrophic bacterial endosymbiont of Bathymodiolus sp.]
MRLQTDPTVIYGMGESYQGNIRKKDLQTLTPYNTYKINGLPPTPIAMPGVEAIHAVLHPAKGSSLYFVANGDGSHNFSATLSEHNRAVQAYLRKR